MRYNGWHIQEKKKVVSRCVFYKIPISSLPESKVVHMAFICSLIAIPGVIDGIIVIQPLSPLGRFLNNKIFGGGVGAPKMGFPWPIVNRKKTSINPCFFWGTPVDPDSPIPHLTKAPVNIGLPFFSTIWYALWVL